MQKLTVDVISSKDFYEAFANNANVELYIDNSQIFNAIMNREASVGRLFLDNPNSTGKYLVVDLLGFNFVTEALHSVYHNRKSTDPNILSIISSFREYCDGYFDFDYSQYKKVIILTERPELGLSSDMSLWFSEEFMASIRTHIKAKTIMIPLRDEDGYVVKEKAKYHHGARAVHEYISWHNDQVMDYDVNAVADKNKITASLSFKEHFNPKEHLYTFYLLRYGKVIQKASGYSKDTRYDFDVPDAGVYVVQGFVKHISTNKMLSKFSFPISFFPDNVKSEYNDFLMNHTPTLLPEYKFLQSTSPFYDYVLFISQNDEREFSEEGFEFTTLDGFGKYKVSILTNGKFEKKEELLRLCSGISYNNMRLGAFSCIDVGESITIHRDNFGFEQAYLYRGVNFSAVSNRLHLLLKKIAGQPDVDFDQVNAVVKFFSVKGVQLFEQQIGYETDITNVSFIPYYMNVNVTKHGGLGLTLNDMGKKLTSLNRFHYEKYFELFQNAVVEIKNNATVILDLAQERGKKLVMDLTGGLDSRLTLASFANVGFTQHDLVRINTKPVDNDLPVAVQINKFFGFNFDDTSESYEHYIDATADQVYRSFYEIMYYTSALSGLRRTDEMVSIYGAYGEFARSYVTEKYHDTHFTDLVSPYDISSWLINDYVNQLCTDNENLLPLVEKFGQVLTREPCTSSAGGRVLSHYVMRHGLHFKSNLRKYRGEVSFSPLNSPSMYLANIYSMPIFESTKLQLDLLGCFHQGLLQLPFDNPMYNAQLSKLAGLLQYSVPKNVDESFLSISTTDKDKYDYAMQKKEKAKTITIRSMSNDTDTAPNKVDVLWSALHKVLLDNPEIEKRIGLHLWFYLKQNIDNSQVLNNTYNRLFAVLDQKNMISEG